MARINTWLLICICIWTSVLANAEDLKAQKVRSNDEAEELELVQVIFRHGDRNPIRPFPNFEYADESFWPEGYAQLTKLGKTQQYELGQYFRKRYGSVLSATYSPHEIYVQSSNVDRTITSALANLAGLYPPSDNVSLWNPEIKWQPIPVHNRPDNDNIIRMESHCPMLKKMDYDFMKNSPVVRELNEKYQSVYEFLTEKTGLKVTDVLGIDAIYDPLFVQNIHYGHWPTWAPEGSYVLEAMKYLRSMSFKFESYTREMQRLRGGPLLKELLTNFRKKVRKAGDNRKKMYMYSGHDTTVAVLLNVMGVFDTQTPSYASTVMMELRKNTVLGTHTLKVYLKNETDAEPYLLEIPGCGNPCTLETFAELMEPKIPEFWEQECMIPDNVPDYVAMAAAVALSGILVSLLFLMALKIFVPKEEIDTISRKDPLNYMQI